MSNGHRWSKFWWQDWQGDTALQGCSYAARGLWMEMLCIAHEAEQCGHLLINGKQPTAKRLATATGGTEKEVVKLLAELETEGVFSRAEDGTIYCRRMVRDKASGETFQAWGRTGGNPTLNGKEHHPKKTKGGLTPPLNPPPYPPPLSQGVNRGGYPLEAESEAEAEAEAPPYPPAASRPRFRNGFLELIAREGMPSQDGQPDDETSIFAALQRLSAG